MFNFFSKRTILLNHCRSIDSLLHYEKSQLGITVGIRCFCSTLTDTNKSPKPVDEKKQSFTISYLINSCGLSPDAANSASKCVLFDNSKNPDSVLSLLRNHGLTDNQISKFVRNNPRLLIYDVKKTILPKFEFLSSIGFSTQDLVLLLTRSPLLVNRSLKQYLIPFCDILKDLHGSDEKVKKMLTRMSSRNFSNIKSIHATFSLLRRFGIPENIISLLLMGSPNVIFLDADKLSRVVEEVLDMGFEPSKSTIAYAIVVKVQLSQTTWKCKLDSLMKWGLSEDEILLAFRKFPRFMLYSEESNMKKMDFLVKMGWQSAIVLKHPVIFCYNLDTRIVPRCSILRLLVSKGLIKSKVTLLSIIVPSNKRFLDYYVVEHKQQVPELLDVFEGRINPEELDFGFDDKHAALLV